MKLTDHFTLAEFEHSQTADRLGIDNTPLPEVMDNLYVAAHGLEMIRMLLQTPILITSGYRCPALNKHYAQVICLHLLDPFDHTGSHCK